MAACSGKNENCGFFCKIFLGKNGFWTFINVHFGSADPFLCFDFYRRWRTLFIKSSKNRRFITFYEKNRRCLFWGCFHIISSLRINFYTYWQRSTGWRFSQFSGNWMTFFPLFRVTGWRFSQFSGNRMTFFPFFW